MTAAWIDTEAARRAVRAWSRHADEVHRQAFELEHLLAALSLDGSAPRHLARAATELWNAADYLRRVTDAAASADRPFDPRRPGDVARLPTPSGWRDPPTYSSAFGDPGGTGDVEVRRPYEPNGATPVEQARSLIVRALTDTADERQIRADEFQVVRLDSGRYVVVLPGVIDLSAPDPGWHEHHRSVRDLDQAAFSSSRSTGLAGNPYARLVRDGLARAGVPTGAELLLVGHSFGADTALDLAADAAFRAATGYRITHVVAAGYHSGPQLPHVPSSTEVLVLQNRRDVPVIVEAVGAAHVTEAIAAQATALRAAATGDPATAMRHQRTALGHQLGAVRAAGRQVADRFDEVARAALGAVAGDPRRVREGVTGLATPDAGVGSPRAGQIVSVFDGPGDGFGHLPAYYADHARRVDDPVVRTFLDSLARTGYVGPGVALAVDVSVPG